MMDLNKEIVLNPLVGIKIDDININFGTKLEDVENLLRESLGETYENIGISLECDDHDLLEYIEFDYNCLMVCNVSIYGHNLYEIPVRDLYNILSKHCENIHEEITGITHYNFVDIGVRFGIEYIGEHPDWTEEEIDRKDEYEFYAVTSIGIWTKDTMEN
jgi:hypothetical protein